MTQAIIQNMVRINTIVSLKALYIMKEIYFLYVKLLGLNFMLFL